jgi:hypothetical protein
MVLRDPFKAMHNISIVWYFYSGENMTLYGCVLMLLVHKGMLLACWTRLEVRGERLGK